MGIDGPSPYVHGKERGEAGATDRSAASPHTSLARVRFKTTRRPVTHRSAIAKQKTVEDEPVRQGVPSNLSMDKIDGGRHTLVRMKSSFLFIFNDGLKNAFGAQVYFTGPNFLKLIKNLQKFWRQNK